MSKLRSDFHALRCRARDPKGPWKHYCTQLHMRILFDIPDIIPGTSWGMLISVGRLLVALSSLPCDVALVPGGLVDCCDPALGEALLGSSSWRRIHGLPRSRDKTPDLVCRVVAAHEPRKDQLPTCELVYNTPFPVKYHTAAGRLCVFPLNGAIDRNYFPVEDRQRCRSYFELPAGATIALKLISAAPIAEQNLVPLLDAVVELFRLGRAITLIVKSIPVPASRLGEFQATVKAALARGLLSRKWWTKYTDQGLFIFLEDILPIPEMRGLYNASDFLVDTEGPLSSGMCVAEATACGIPSIVPATAAAHSQNPFVKRVPAVVPEGVTGRNIVLSSPELADSILCMLDDKALHCKAKAFGYAHAAMNFDADRTAGLLLGVSRLAREHYF